MVSSNEDALKTHQVQPREQLTAQNLRGPIPNINIQEP